MSRRGLIERLAESNRERYGTDDGRAMLGLLDLAFEHPWIYVFELVQNAVDAGARSVSVRIREDQDGLVFQHDGDSALGREEVEGLSKVSRSTKGVASVGFMGIGFKSVFGRFLQARVSGWGWKFRYDIPVVIGDFGDVHVDQLGAVLPLWDDGIAEPDEGFTTRFELRGRRDQEAEIGADLAQFLPSDDKTLLAILADAGVRRLEVEDSVWALSVDGGDVEGSAYACALCGDVVFTWCLFSVAFRPSRDAIAKFLERRQIRPAAADKAEVYAAASKERRVLGVLPLDELGVPVPPARGRVYATLPTAVEVSFGLHIQADWLLNISRTSLGEIEDDAWQRDIADRLASLIAVFLKWVAQTLRSRAAATAAYAALRRPEPERRGLEAILSEARWLQRLRDELQSAKVVPVWVDGGSSVAFETPERTIVPPAPLGRAFEDEPALKPGALLKGQVLARNVLGQSGRELLMAIDLMKEMGQREIEDVWHAGLEHWWSGFDDDDDAKRDLLFRLWAAVWESATGGNWSVDGIRCVRTASGAWRSVEDTSFFDEPLPSRNEPGGGRMRELVEGFIDWSEYIPEAWTQGLRQAASREWPDGYNTVARDFIETHASGVGLTELIRDAADQVDQTDPVDVVAIVALGQWAKNRRRPDLLVRVLGETQDGQRGFKPESALISAPYVRGQDREALFPGIPVISDQYLEGGPTADPAEWRVFFKDAGAKGGVVVETVRKRQAWDTEAVGVFLGRDLDGQEYANNAGFALEDFVIKPQLPKSDAPAEIRAAVSGWLDDGFEALRGKGRRQASYTFRKAKVAIGKRPSKWVKGLSSLAWVPCRNGELRRPGETLSESDPSRPDAPTSVLSTDLVVALENEGLKFGTEVPESPSLLRLESTGHRLSSEAFAMLLRDVRASVAATEDETLFEQVLRKTGVPASSGEFVPVERIVGRVGGGRLRSRLGGWVVPLEEFSEEVRAELEHRQFPVAVAETTTGRQALAFLRDVWRRALDAPDRLADEVRDLLPVAYAYCLEDWVEDAALKRDWDEALAEAAVFVDRDWVVLADVAGEVFLDDVDDRRFLPVAAKVRTVTGGHLGETLEKQIRVARELGLPLVSESVHMEWAESGTVETNWSPRFRQVCELVAAARAGDRGTTAMPDTSWVLRTIQELMLRVRFQDAEAENVLVHARLHDGALTVAGRPVEFGADAAKELLHELGYRQRADLSADLTAMLIALDDEEGFRLAAQKFRRSFAPDFQLALSQDPGRVVELASCQTEQRHDDAGEEPVGEVKEPGGADLVAGSSGGSREESAEPKQEKAASDGDSTEAGDAATRTEGGGGPSSSFTRERRLAMQRAAVEEVKRAKDALKAALVGEMALPMDAETDSVTEVEETVPRTRDGGLGDEVYRLVAAEYERNCGREPELGDPNQPGWDLRSIDTESGVERLIEVKGKGCLWESNEVVELSRAQVRKAFGELQDDRLWYLYVVERVEDDEYVVLPIRNPVGAASGWMLAANGWREVAEDEGQVVLPGEVDDVGD